MVAVSSPVERPRIPHPLHVRLSHEEVVELVGCPCPDVVPCAVRACVPASCCLAGERCGRIEPACPKKGAKVVASYILPLIAILAAGAIASGAPGVA